MKFIGPQVCVCSRRGKVHNTHPSADGKKVRGYKCKCGRTWQSIECVLRGKPKRGRSNGAMAKFIAQSDKAIRRRTAKILIGLATELRTDGDQQP